MMTGASAGNPRPANALSTIFVKPLRVTTNEGMPAFSSLAAARPAFVEQDPHCALPTMTA